jgi:hypothetical protein
MIIEPIPTDIHMALGSVCVLCYSSSYTRFDENNTTDIYYHKVT